MNAAPLAETGNNTTSITWTQPFQIEKNPETLDHVCTSVLPIEAEPDSNLHERFQHCMTSSFLNMSQGFAGSQQNIAGAHNVD